MHPIYQVKSFEIIDDYFLKVEFDDGTFQQIDFRPVLAGELYGPLQDLSLFNQVEIDPEVKTLVWPNGADFDPATLHDWPEYVDDLEAQAQKWMSTRLLEFLEEYPIQRSGKNKEGPAPLKDAGPSFMSKRF